MDENKILERLRYSLRKNDVLNLAEIFSKQPNGIAQLFELTTKPDPILAFHSAWVLEHTIINNPKLLEKWVIPIIKAMPITKNLSVQRHYTKIVKCALEYANARNIMDLKKNRSDAEQLIEVCFEWLLNSATPIAVKSYCMDILMHFAHSNPWIKEELPHVIRLNSIDASPGIASKSRKILAKLNNHETD